MVSLLCEVFESWKWRLPCLVAAPQTPDVPDVSTGIWDVLVYFCTKGGRVVHLFMPVLYTQNSSISHPSVEVCKNSKYFFNMSLRDELQRKNFLTAPELKVNLVCCPSCHFNQWRSANNEMSDSSSISVPTQWRDQTLISDETSMDWQA